MSPVVLIVAQAFKGTLDAHQVGAACSAGVIRAGAEPVVLHGSDGGDGLLEALEPLICRTTEHRVIGPAGSPVSVTVGWLDDRTAVIESRLACGLGLLGPGERNPLRTTTRGVGELIAEVASSGGTRVYVGLGGSGTMDGGLGMARAWGWVPRDAGGRVLPEGGGFLAELESLDPGHPPGSRITGLVDVRNPLVGPQGAGMYAAQKGATPEAETRLALGLERLAEGARELALSPGAGAAGGLGFGILRFAGGDLVPGAPWVLDRIEFDQRLDGASAVMVGEGAFDETSRWGKLTGEVLGRAARAGVPAILLAPTVEGATGAATVESGGGRWDAAQLGDRAEVAVRRVLRLPGRGGASSL